MSKHNKKKSRPEDQERLNAEVSAEVEEISSTESEAAEKAEPTAEAEKITEPAEETSAEAPAETTAEEESSGEEKAEEEKKEPTKKERREEKSAEKQKAKAEKKEEFAERKISESENKKLHERFKFDWELEENLIEALDEDAAELAEPEENEPEPIEVHTISFAQAAQTVFGLFVLVFSIVGVIATGFKIADVVKQRKDNSAQIAYFEDFIMPLVASDAPIFDGAQSLNEDVVITAACWDIIFNPSVHYEFSGGAYSVSYLDVDRRITKLFGPGLSYTHKTVGDVDLTFEYDEDTGMYTIPAYPRSPAYFADIAGMSETESGSIELTVCYRLPITNWIESVDAVEKTMIYTLVPTDSEYNVTAIRIGEVMSEAN